jgi:hypothetical protein
MIILFRSHSRPILKSDHTIFSAIQIYLRGLIELRCLFDEPPCNENVGEVCVTCHHHVSCL